MKACKDDKKEEEEEWKTVYILADRNPQTLDKTTSTSYTIYMILKNTTESAEL